MEMLKQIRTIKLLIHVIIMSFMLFSCDKDEEVLELIVTVSTNDLSATIDENPTNGLFIGNVEGSTNDGNVTYEITSESTNGAFAINSSTGELTVADSSLFDYEINSTLTAVVEVSNMDVIKNANVLINLNDVDETVYISFTEINPNDPDLLGGLGRWGHQSVTFKEKIWVIGGIGPVGGGTNSKTNDIWSSADGINWTKTSIVGIHFSERSGHQVLVFNDKMWVIGGSAASSGGTVRSNEIWSTSDGANWTEETIIGNHFSGRSGHQSLIFNNKLWVIGGSDGANLLNDVWSSANGINWVEEIADAPFSTKNYHQAISFNNKLWIIGGSDTIGAQNDVWSSFDGRDWQKENIVGSHFLERSSHRVVLFRNKLWLINGELGTQQYDDIWTSLDGINWSEESIAGTYFSGRADFEAVVFNDSLWIIGGKRGAALGRNDIWVLD